MGTSKQTTFPGRS